MKTNNLDNTIKEKLASRTFVPSASAWERLSVQLDEQPKKNKKPWLFYFSVAASIVLLISVGVYIFNKKNATSLPKEEYVVSPKEIKSIDKKIDQLINEIPIKEALVNQQKIENNKNLEKVILPREKKQHKKKVVNNIKKEQLIIAKLEEGINTDKKTIIEKKLVNKTTFAKQDPKSTIKINAEDLLYAVTHSPKEVKEYYAKYNVNREDVLRTIKNELKKSNIKVNPNTILAEVERTIIDDDFQNNFMKSLKRRVSDIATVIASRND